MSLLLIALLPFLGCIPPLILDDVFKVSRTKVAWSSAIGAALALALLIAQAPAILAGETRTFSIDWVPALGLSFSFYLDGLSWLFAVLITGIGLLILLYARYYLRPVDDFGKFFSMMTFFMGSMGGMVLSGNIILLAVFWELTSISSFLLIGYWSSEKASRDGARMALAVTGAGGLALLGGVIILGNIAGTFELPEILAAGSSLLEHPLATLSLVLILLGAFTKSAQFPFHFWLPAAMAAPTPVSAYLHSATMVKAGVFLLARMHPVYSSSDWWFYLVSSAGLITLLLGAYAALLKHDLKGVLAYSTISHLGLITLLLGFSAPLAAVAAIFHIINHATFKASLFMAVGIIDHETGTRDIRILGGLWKAMPITALLAIVAAASMAGVPLLNGFLSKEMFFTEAASLRLGTAMAWFPPFIATLAGTFSVAYSVRFIHRVFFEGDGAGMPIRNPHEPPRWMRAPVELLVLLCIVVGILPEFTVKGMLHAASNAVLGGEVPEFSLHIFHGFNLPLLMSVVALGAGTLLYTRRQLLYSVHDRFVPSVIARDIYDWFVLSLAGISGVVTRTFENGSLQRYALFAVLAAVGVGVAAAFPGGTGVATPAAHTPVDIPTVVGGAVLMILALATAVYHRRRLIALVMISGVGLMVVLAFVRLSAPDLALTQLLVEVVTILLLLLALHFMPTKPPREARLARKWRDGVVAVVAGAATGAAVLAVMRRPFDSISQFFVEQSVPGGGGHNIVNVILVDFRGYDTMGEITVMGIAAIGIMVMLSGATPYVREEAGVPARDKHPVFLSMISRPLLPLAMLVSVYILLRGHNLPGGGFIAALLTSVALIVQYLANGNAWTDSRLTLRADSLIPSGLLVAGFTGLASWAFGYPFLTSHFGHVHIPLLGDVELASAIAFDLGVYLTVVGAVLVILTRLGQLTGEDHDDAQPGEEAHPWRP